MIAGIGGTGVVTIGAILGTAAQIDGKGIRSSRYDWTCSKRWVQLKVF